MTETSPGDARTAGAAVGGAASIMARLRGPGGCPWDREQTFDSIKQYTLEETYEVFDAIERRDWPDLRDELGDLLLQVLFYAQMAEEAGYFALTDVADSLCAKLIRRHPHIFGETVAQDSAAVKRTWEQIKHEERKLKPASASLLDDISRSMPAMLEAAKLGGRAAKTGFDWPNVNRLFEKLAEETAELQAELELVESSAVEEEFGDLLFTAVQLGRHLGVDAESALRRTNGKFRRRFAAMECAAGGPHAMSNSTAEELEALWSEAKAGELESQDLSDGER